MSGPRIRRPIVRAWWWMALALAVSPVLAEDLLMVRSRQPFEEAMLTLQSSIGEAGYTVARVQRVDVGLTNMGYKTDKYRVVFLARLDELQALSDAHPELVPYLPLQISVIAEGRQTLLVTANPQDYKLLYPDAELGKHFDAWEKDLRAILDRVRVAKWDDFPSEPPASQPEH